jgi:hypothetical protein
VTHVGEVPIARTIFANATHVVMDVLDHRTMTVYAAQPRPHVILMVIVCAMLDGLEKTVQYTMVFATTDVKVEPHLVGLMVAQTVKAQRTSTATPAPSMLRKI